ncbi:alternate-type signal peptide domain-containing protein [Glutamicibacter sp. MNS18]|uniref:alternate-type signal peptide domain-containing protein n=1 Tax=Glutamicibacter sp. MNS18 TaxID=2989817 RepID=UPI002235513F|nr:alternate-type signal peptide domain-containing protein [Glutamicibacter sp. MNS18]MCW4465482.1 alternate-type signal peptide domain-containing protein [Glutamicibacter sp. MNS18]
MKKVTKATIAAAAAGALLLGGAGTLALWSDSTAINAGPVSTGHLTLGVSAGPVVWSDISDPENPGSFDPAVDKIVPGDTVTFSKNVTISAVGKNLAGELEVNTNEVVPAELSDFVDIEIDVDASADGLTVDGDVISFENPGDYEIPVTVTVDFAEGDTGETPRSTMNQDIVLGDFVLTLNQVR